jgi:hypothetical protein
MADHFCQRFAPPFPPQNNTLRRGKGSLQTARLVGDHFAAILAPFFSATDNFSRKSPRYSSTIPKNKAKN